jgi:response regulator of citrate/malate metabolism
MKVLIVEDDPHKLNKLSAEICSFSAFKDIKKVTSLQEAMAAVSSSIFDLVVLDMAIPSHTGGLGGIDVYSQPVGGLDILLYLSFNDIPAKVIIVTQYPTVEYNQRHVPLHDLQDELSKDSVENVVDVIFFSEDNDWKEPFNKALRREI